MDTKSWRHTCQDTHTHIHRYTRRRQWGDTWGSICAAHLQDRLQVAGACAWLPDGRQLIPLHGSTMVGTEALTAKSPSRLQSHAQDTTSSQVAGRANAYDMLLPSPPPQYPLSTRPVQRQTRTSWHTHVLATAAVLLRCHGGGLYCQPGACTADPLYCPSTSTPSTPPAQTRAWHQSVCGRCTGCSASRASGSPLHSCASCWPRCWRCRG
mmetsp:Transcript_14478/g.31446  ORF Transcript_14478/g.31446 Transcript_14478/m.31446 type:complete len:210 (+) Transcript_14478:1055-1684(+)